MIWERSWRADPRARALADRHYNRQSVGAPQFVPPGRCVVLLTPEAGAVWVTSWQKHVRHAYPGAWVNSLFRNERRDLYLASDLIREAVAITRGVFGDPPTLGMISFVNKDEVKHKRDPGRCYRKAGFKLIGETAENHLLVWQLLPEDMPEAAVLDQHSLWVA